MKLITYGIKFDRSKFQSVKNHPWKTIKPDGGLWASPINSKYGWYDWCQDEDFGDLSTYFEFEFKGKLLKIDSYNDLLKLPWFNNENKGCFSKSIDFEKLAKNYDGIWLTVEGQWATRYTDPSLYGWDCETVLIFNVDKIKLT